MTRSATSRVADAADHDDRRDAQSAVQRAYQVYKRSDGLFPDQLAHPLVPDHEVRSARVLVHQEERGPDLERLGDVRRLRDPEAFGVEKFCVDLPPGNSPIMAEMSTPATLRPSSALILTASARATTFPGRLLPRGRRLPRRARRAACSSRGSRLPRRALRLRNPHPGYLAAVRQLHRDP